MHDSKRGGTSDGGFTFQVVKRSDKDSGGSRIGGEIVGGKLSLKGDGGGGVEGKVGSGGDGSGWGSVLKLQLQADADAVDRVVDTHLSQHKNGAGEGGHAG